MGSSWTLVGGMVALTRTFKSYYDASWDDRFDAAMKETKIEGYVALQSASVRK